MFEGLHTTSVAPRCDKTNLSENMTHSVVVVVLAEPALLGCYQVGDRG